jgi:hypothetical protein
MSIARSVADVLRDHVVLELEAIDRMYLDVYVPHLQTVGAVVPVGNPILLASEAESRNAPAL